MCGYFCIGFIDFILESKSLLENTNLFYPTGYDLPLIIYILMNIVKNFATIHLWLYYIDVLDVVILLMTYLIKYVFQIIHKV